MELGEKECSYPAAKKLSVFEKVCFALGGAPYQICNTVIGFFISIFLLEVAEISPYSASVIILSSKVWDAITDPLCGTLVTRSPFTRCGRLKPWILGTAPFACVVYFFLWYVPDVSQSAKLGWYVVCYCLFQALLSGLHVPYTSLTMFISEDQRERDSATAYRMVSEVTGVLLAVIIQGAFVQKYHSSQCNEGATESPTINDDLERAYSSAALVVCTMYIVCALIVFIFVKERKGVMGVDQNDSLWSSLKLVLSYGPFVKLTGAFLCISLCLAQIQGNFALYVSHALDLKDYFTTMIMAMLATTVVSIPVWQLLVIRYGKRKIFAAGCIWMLPPVFSLLYLKNNVYLAFISSIFSGAGIAVAFLLPWSMLPDVLDDFMLRTGNRKDAIFYSFFVFFNKFAVGISLGISQAALGAAGYETKSCKQPESVELTLRMLVTPGPVVCLLGALLFLWAYPITEERRREIREAVKGKLKDAQSTENLLASEEQQTNSSHYL